MTCAGTKVRFPLDSMTYFQHLRFFFLATPSACGSSWARDQTHATAITRATAVIIPEP